MAKGVFWYICFSALILSTGSLSAEPYFHQVKAQSGDGIYSLLRRYELESKSCNVQKFLTLNRLDKGDVLVKDALYFIPVVIYKYNGVNIRSSIGNSDYEKAKRIASYNLRILERGLRQTDFRESKILWVPYHEIECSKEASEEKADTFTAKGVDKPKLKSVSKPRHYQIFGDKYAHVPLVDNSLQGQVYYIVSGHGGPDPGAMGKRAGNTLCEDEYAYDIALRLARNFVAHGAVAYVITRDDDGIRDDMYLECDNDEYVWGDQIIPLNQIDRLDQRASTINKLFKRHQKQGVKHQRAIMLHIDSRRDDKRIDVFFYHHNKSKTGKKLARNMLRVMKRKYAQYRPNGEYTGIVTTRNLFMLRNTQPASVYVELGNIQHPIDQMRFTLVKNRQYLADWLFEGLTTSIKD